MSSLSPFISRENLATFMKQGADLSADEDALIAVDSACDIVRNETRQSINHVDDEEIILDGTGTDSLPLPERPVTEVSEVSVNGTVVDNYVLNGTGSLIRKGTDASIDWNVLPRLFWPLGRQNIAITYSHGWEDADLPRDIRVIALRIAKRLFEPTASAGVSGESLGSYSVTYATTATAQQDIITTQEKAVLRTYRAARTF